MIGLSRRRNRDVNTWPGFVDALATLLMVIIFLLMIFVIAQVYLGAALSGRDEALSDLTAQVNELTNLLSLERGNNQRMELELTQLTTELSNTADQRDDLRNRAATLADQLASMNASKVGHQVESSNPSEGKSRTSIAASSGPSRAAVKVAVSRSRSPQMNVW